ncbi:hypothetical protein [Wolbachia endosymbiont of Wuchereria bancrofti]|uniref:hypothetical protein n=1 Tax=Wolbachia endosymbiont of Wuchereria bancrofti TaxID=96496 RepID=UPI000347F4B5|nr:hypothetical protein [Wolbachia endosymbiont of Wuchereria bancrofti]
MGLFEWFKGFKSSAENTDVNIALQEKLIKGFLKTSINLIIILRYKAYYQVLTI